MARRAVLQSRLQGERHRIRSGEKGTPDHVVITESALDGQEIAIAFKPREEWPKAFKYYRLYK